MFNRKPPSRRVILLLSLLIAVIAYAVIAEVTREDPDPKDYAKVVAALRAPTSPVEKFEVVKGYEVTVRLRRGEPRSITAEYPDERSLRELVVQAEKRKIPVLVETPERSFWRLLLLQLVPVLLMVGLLFVLMSRMGSGGLMGGRRFKATTIKSDITFNDVAGLGEARNEVQEIVEFLKHPDRFRKLGARVPRGVLFVGPPGTGKTLLAKAVAGESHASFYNLSGSDFVEMFAGLGARRMRQVFAEARKTSPSIVFIDEIDAVGRSRSGGGNAGHEEREQTLNQMLTEMDGFDAHDKVVVIAATNRADVLDAALTRPGRFDRQITVDPPDLHGRQDILRVHAQGKPIDPQLLDAVARKTPGFSGAELANLLNEAAILAAREGRDSIDAHLLDSALLRVVAGLENRKLMTEEERERVAYHEVGHALCAALTEHPTPVQKISLISRGRALGFTLSIPEQDRLLETRASLEDRLVMLLGGRAAEILMFGTPSSGAANDLQRATDIAMSMICEMGLSARIGPRHVTMSTHQPSAPVASPETSSLIDAEVRETIETAQDRALQLLKQHRPALLRVTAALMEQENMDAAEFARLLHEDSTS